MEKWYNYEFQSAPHTGADFKQFARDLRKELNRQLRQIGCQMAKYNVGHFEVSGFAEKDGEFVYFNSGNVRYGNGLKWDREILIRTAESTTDFRGGRNQRTSLESFGENVRKLLERKKR